MRVLRWSAFLAAVVLLVGVRMDVPPTVQQLDMQRYLGTWYEIARLPFWIQEGCVGTTATYELRADGQIGVDNRCFDRRLDGRERRSVGHAWMPDPNQPGRLKVQFFWPISGDYWILALDDDYQWSLVGTPDRKYLWILSRTPIMAPGLYDDLVERARRLGYPVGKLIVTPH